MVLVSLALLVSCVTIAVETLLSTAEITDGSVSRTRLQTETHSIEEMLVKELMAANIDSISPSPFPDGSDTLSYRRAVGIVAGAPIFSDERTIGLRDAPSDPVDGIDNDGDGLVDERQLVMIRRVGEVNEQVAVISERIPRLAPNELSNNVDDDGNGLIDESGLSFSLSGDLLVIRLSLMGRHTDRGMITKSVETAVRLRNRNP